MNIMRVFFVSVFLLPGIFLPSEAADTLPTQLNLETGWDSEEGRDYFIDADIDMGGPRLALGYGESNAEFLTTVLETTTKQVSVSSNPLEDIATSLGYSEWGQEGAINIRTYRLQFVFNSADWSLSLGPQTRDIQLNTLLMTRPVLDIDSNGVNLGISYYGASWSLGLNYHKNNYSRDVSVLSSHPIMALIFSPATMDHAFGFEDNRITTDLTYSYDWGSIGADHTRSISAVDNSVSIASAVSMRYKAGRNSDIRIRVGQSENSFSTEQTLFVTLGLGYRF